MQGAEKNFAAPHRIDMLARNFLRNAAGRMKSGLLEVPFKSKTHRALAYTKILPRVA